MEIIYSLKVSSVIEDELEDDILKESFKDAILINKKLHENNKRVAYFFIDPLINNFEAANNFYFNILECNSISKINTYKSGASPIQALYDAKELIDNNLYDAIFIFGKELLLSDMKNNREDVKKAMNIFETKSLIECYNLLAHRLCEEIDLSKEKFKELSDILYDNYIRASKKDNESINMHSRGRVLEDINADLFKLTDCANPNIDFAGGIIVSNSETAKLLAIDSREIIKVIGCKYNMTQGLPETIDKIVGKRDRLFPHLKEAFTYAQGESKVDVSVEYKNDNLLMEVYTCYPPIPIGFLLATELVKDINDVGEFLDKHQITVSGGLNLARAPWNNPALNGLIEVCKKMKNDSYPYGLVHGNGGIGEVQGIAILELNDKEGNICI